MEQGLLQLRELTLEDQDIVRMMQTNIDDDYVLNIFPDLVQSNSNSVYGLFDDDHLLAIAGSSFFPGGYAMLGRLRSDKRYLSKGNATKILAYIKSELEKDPSITWVGANTNMENIPARRVLEKIGLQQVTRLHSLYLIDETLLNGTKGSVWQAVETIEEKRRLLQSLKQENALGVYPYECYYPFPFSDNLLTDEHLNDSAFFQNQSKDRFLVIKKDQKRDWFAQVKYFWNDHFQQPGFWETVLAYTEQQPEEGIKPWVDFSQTGYERIPNLDTFKLSDGWVLYGKWI
ncbi:GNAT family N-acetyltransferase [Aquibacillus rhizosphaerae]|uniref:N-acetyltransferase n=1 Tax=Aquibacillus rhizosphaerae TaxID=3051431 RepID=A0ABT7L280_9BACI|nr:N-acetyltransferase [Aquibacillus sp. LR5S19]MDL4839317.1 N-acetyltransferase [Aquibacillus sp. LR5S19]